MLDLSDKEKADIRAAQAEIQAGRFKRAALKTLWVPPKPKASLGFDVRLRRRRGIGCHWNVGTRANPHMSVFSAEPTGHPAALENERIASTPELPTAAIWQWVFSLTAHSTEGKLPSW